MTTAAQNRFLPQTQSHKLNARTSDFTRTRTDSHHAFLFDLEFFVCGHNRRHDQRNQRGHHAPFHSDEPAFPSLTFERPVQITHAGDGSDRLFVVEQPGRVLVFPNSSEAEKAEVFIDLTDPVNDATNEEGLLSRWPSIPTTKRTAGSSCPTSLVIPAERDCRGKSQRRQSKPRLDLGCKWCWSSPNPPGTTMARPCSLALMACSMRHLEMAVLRATLGTTPKTPRTFWAR